MEQKATQFFADYSLPQLATAWKEVACKGHADSKLCTQIAILHAIAVDSFATGITVCFFFSKVNRDKFSRMVKRKRQTLF